MLRCTYIGEVVNGKQPRRKYAARLPREERRTQLLDVALQLLGDRHLNELTMEAVAKAAGIGKPVAYSAFGSRTELVSALLMREHQRAMAQLGAAIPANFSQQRPTAAYAATVQAFLTAVIEHPNRWRLVLTVPESAPREYRDSLRNARSAIVAQAEFLAGAARLVQPRLGDLDAGLLAHTMVSFAEMLGRLALNDPQTYSRERLEQFVTAALSPLGG